jgi:hypothetical protein
MGIMKEYKTGIYDISNADYHASSAISRSGISILKKSPLHFWNKYLNPDKEEEKGKEGSSAMTIGTAVHTLVLQPSLWDSEFFLLEKVDSRTKAGKEYMQEVASKSKGKVLIKSEDAKKAQEIAAAMLEHKIVNSLLKGSNIEKSLFWQDEESGLLCKARPDIWHPTINVIADIKTANDSSIDSFSYSVKQYNYHIQAAMQIDAVLANTGCEVSEFFFIVASTEAPYKPYVYLLPSEAIEIGRKEYKDALKILKKCFENKKWDVEREKIIPLFFSQYSFINNFITMKECYNV